MSDKINRDLQSFFPPEGPSSNSNQTNAYHSGFMTFQDIQANANSNSSTAFHSSKYYTAPDASEVPLPDMILNEKKIEKEKEKKKADAAPKVFRPFILQNPSLKKTEDDASPTKSKNSANSSGENSPVSVVNEIVDYNADEDNDDDLNEGINRLTTE